MGLFETPGQSETSFSSMAESSFISSSMGNHFGIFALLDFVLAAFFLRFMWRAFAFNFLFLHTHGLGATGRNEQFGFGEGLDLFERGVGREFAEEEAAGCEFDKGEFGDDVVGD